MIRSNIGQQFTGAMTQTGIASGIVSNLKGVENKISKITSTSNKEAETELKSQGAINEASTQEDIDRLTADQKFEVDKAVEGLAQGDVSGIHDAKSGDEMMSRLGFGSLFGPEAAQDSMNEYEQTKITPEPLQTNTMKAYAQSRKTGLGPQGQGMGDALKNEFGGEF